jgi:RluA family pseudouridine synthase
MVRANEKYFYHMPDLVEPGVNAAIRILHEDKVLIIVNKPAPLPMHPGGRFNKNTLQYFLAQACFPQRPRPAHRLDADTTGVVAWTKTRHFAKLLQPQFSAGLVEKVYLVRTRGLPAADTFFSDAPITDEPGTVGSRRVDQDTGRDARTDFRVLNRFKDGTALIEARPKTGRTNQIRIHLRELGLPVCGDQTYLADGSIGSSMTLDTNDPPLCLHSWKMAFLHPVTREAVEFEAPPPAWASENFTISGNPEGQK